MSGFLIVILAEEPFSQMKLYTEPPEKQDLLGFMQVGSPCSALLDHTSPLPGSLSPSFGCPEIDNTQAVYLG